ncbi:MAG: CPXCG motif-containing cysteine-rich protein [bacterium]
MDKDQSKTMYFNTENFIFYNCAYCSQENVIEVDISGGFAQEYVEDCQICCCPNSLKIMFNDTTQLPEVEVQYLG